MEKKKTEIQTHFACPMRSGDAAGQKELFTELFGLIVKKMHPNKSDSEILEIISGYFK